MHRSACRLPAFVAVFASALAVRADDLPSAATPASFPPAPPALAESIQGLLDEGFSGPKRFQAAQNKLESARNLATDDPRVDYAYGLVLLKQLQHKPAIAQFEAAVGRPGAPYFPAWQALIWAQLAEKQYDKGLDRLDELAALVRQSQNESPAAGSSHDTVLWMGQILEAVDRLGTSKKHHELVDRHDVRLRETLGDELYTAVELGRDIVHHKDLDLSHKAGLARDAAESQRNSRRQSQTRKLDSDLEDIDKEKATAAKSVEEWKQWLDATLAKADEQLKALEKQFHYLEVRGETLRQATFELPRDILALETQLNFVPAQSQGSSAFNKAQQQLSVKQNQLLNLQKEYLSLLGRHSELVQAGQLTIQQRAAVVQKYEKATGDLVKKNAELDKWTARVAEKKQKLDLPAGKPQGTGPSPIRKVVSLKSYVPLDLEAEKLRVLTSYGIEPIAPSEPTSGK